MTHQQMTFYLLQCVQHHTNQDQQRCSAKELRELHTYTGNPGKSRHDSHYCKEKCSRQSNTVHDGIQIIFGTLSRLNTRNEPVVSLQIIRHLSRIDRDSCIEICKQDNQYSKYEVVPKSGIVHKCSYETRLFACA